MYHDGSGSNDNRAFCFVSRI